MYPARAQDNNPPPRLGVHFAYDVARFAGGPLEFNRIGAQAMFPVGEVWSLYPAMSGVFDTRANWQLSGYVRLDPVPSRPAMPWYLGGGLSFLTGDGRSEVFDVLLTGLEAGLGVYRPFVELQALGVLQD